MLTETIRSKVVAGVVLREYASHPMWVTGGNGIAGQCRGCDAPITATEAVSVCYRSHPGELHWFHLACDEIRKDITNTARP